MLGLRLFQKLHLKCKKMMVTVEGKDFPRDGYKPVSWRPNMTRPIWLELNRILKSISKNPGVPVTYHDFVSGGRSGVLGVCERGEGFEGEVVFRDTGVQCLGSS